MSRFCIWIINSEYFVSVLFRLSKLQGLYRFETASCSPFTLMDNYKGYKTMLPIFHGILFVLTGCFSFDEVIEELNPFIRARHVCFEMTSDFPVIPFVPNKYWVEKFLDFTRIFSILPEKIKDSYFYTVILTNHLPNGLILVTFDRSRRTS